jgi:hypothetical protein
MTEDRYSWISRQFDSRRSWASICSAQRLEPSIEACEPIAMSKESASECAGSVLITSVRLPASAARTAVAAARSSFRPRPFPVNRSTRIAQA